jgi:hypothetical protein
MLLKYLSECIPSHNFFEAFSISFIKNGAKGLTSSMEDLNQIFLPFLFFKSRV